MGKIKKLLAVVVIALVSIERISRAVKAGVFAITAAVFTCYSPGLAAAIVQFDSKTNFLNALLPIVPKSESFEFLPAPVNPSDNLVNTISADGFAVTDTAESMNIYTNTNCPGDACPADGNQNLLWFSGKPIVIRPLGDPGELVFTFDSPVRSFGVTITDSNDRGVNPSLSAKIDDGLPLALLSGRQPNGNNIFFGAVSDTAINTISFMFTTDDNVGDGIAFDEVLSTTVVPLPAGFLLFVSALAVLPLLRRKFA